MKIERRDGNQRQKALALDDLTSLLSSRADAPPPCAPTCPDAFSPRCSRYCPDICRLLSSDPEKHPLEPRIAPLVYELQRLEVFRPCWSCEGHNDARGDLWKIPRVWFYCDSLAHTRALADAVKQLEFSRRLNASWQVALVSFDSQNPDCTFSLEPVVTVPGVSLDELQADIDTIARELRDLVIKSAGDLARLIR